MRAIDSNLETEYGLPVQMPLVDPEEEAAPPGPREFVKLLARIAMRLARDGAGKEDAGGASS